jgi:hypothetical protein
MDQTGVAKNLLDRREMENSDEITGGYIEWFTRVENEEMEAKISICCVWDQGF